MTIDKEYWKEKLETKERELNSLYDRQEIYDNDVKVGERAKEQLSYMGEEKRRIVKDIEELRKILEVKE